MSEKHEGELANKAFKQLYQQMFTGCGIDHSHKTFWKIIAEKASRLAETDEMKETLEHKATVVNVEKVRDFLRDAEEFAKNNISITAQHAYSLSELVEWFKKMIEQASKDGFVTKALGRSDELTAGYCDELLEDLGCKEESTKKNKSRLKLSCKCRTEYRDIPSNGWFGVEPLQCIHCHGQIVREIA